jgi:PhnB protein
MTQVFPYLFFNGNCRQAMEFYAKHIGGELQIMTYAEAPKGEVPPGLDDRIMHAALKKGDMMIMASDGMENDPIKFGNSVHLSLSVDTIEEAEKLFRTLSENGRVKMPLAESFWAKRFGTLTDAFGINWMINCEGK